ncbi:MAG: hypothetical protein ACE37N_04515 [Pseudohongiellaceae bacterium]
MYDGNAMFEAEVDAHQTLLLDFNGAVEGDSIREFGSDFGVG